MTNLSEDEILAVLSEFVARETVNPPGNEALLADYLSDRLQASPVNFTIERQAVRPNRPNIVARAGNPAKGSLLLTGHMDVVPAEAEAWSGDPFTLRREADRLIGRGTADMKGALAAKLVAAESFLTAHPDAGEVILAFTVDEEVGNAGTKALVDDGVDADAAIIGEPTELQVATAEYGAVGYSVTVQGKSGHSGRPDRAVNAIDGLRRVLDRVEALDQEVQSQEHALLEPGPTVNITQIEGGSAPNVVPGEARVTVDWRTLPNDRDPDAFDEQFAAFVEDATLNGDPVEVAFERGFFSGGFETDADASIVESTLAAAHASGIESERTGFNAGSDARFLAQAGIPTVLFGPGSVSDDAHAVDESIMIDDLLKAAETYRSVLERLLR